MSRNAVRALGLGAFLAVGLGVAVVVSPEGTNLAVEIYVLAVAAAALALLLLSIATALPRTEPGAAEPAAPPRRLRQLESVASVLDLAESSSFDLHHSLRPMVREIASARLVGHGVSLDRQPERARALLGDEAWELARPDREAPAGRGYRGCSRQELRAIVDALEAI